MEVLIMRAFLAIEIEESLKNKIKKTQQTIKNTNSAKIKYVEDENIHLTLKFFGEINQRKQKQISSIIRKTTENYETYTQNLLDDIGIFMYEKCNRWQNLSDRGLDLPCIVFFLESKNRKRNTGRCRIT